MFLGLPLLILAQLLGIVAAELAWPRIDGPAALGLALACAAGALAGGRVPALRLGLALAVAFAAGAAGLATRLDAAASVAPRETRDLTLEAEVCALDRSGPRRSLELCSAVEVASPGTLPGSAQRSPLPTRLIAQYRSASAEAGVLNPLRRGDRIRARVRIAPLGGLRNPGRDTPERRWQRRGIAGRVRFLDPGLLVRVREPGPGRDPSAGVRARLEAARERISAGLRGGPGSLATAESGALLAALGVGDRGGLGFRTRDAFARLGIAHLLAISGLHLALVAGLIYSLARFGLGWAGDRGRDLRLGAGVLAGLGALGYALLAGFGVPVQRALLFVGASLVALRLGRSMPGAHLLAGAWMVVGMGAPHALFDLGTQLSFAATGALLLASRRPRVDAPVDAGAAGRVARRLRLLVHLSALAAVATAPFLAWRGLAVGGPGLVLNVIAIPWTSLVLLPAALLSAVAVGFSGSAAQGVLQAGHAIAALTLDAVHALSDAIPDAARAHGRPRVPALGVVLALAALACRLTRTREVVIVSVAALVWLRTAPIADPYAPPPRLVMFDVGQGDALLVQGAGAAVLIDAGRAIPGVLDLGRSVVIPALAALGVERLDAVVATHGDIDHRGGVASVLETLPVGQLWLPWRGGVDPAFASILAVARRRAVEVIELGAGAESRRIGGLRVTPLWPPREGGSPSANARSLVLRMELSGWRILLTGDIGAEIEGRLRLSGEDLSADILKVAHHGSRGSSTEAFLRAVAPRWLMLSAPCGGASRLPHPQALARLAAYGGRLAWTGRDGAVVVDLKTDPSAEVADLAPGRVRARPCARPDARRQPLRGARPARMPNMVDQGHGTDEWRSPRGGPAHR